MIIWVASSEKWKWQWNESESDNKSKQTSKGHHDALSCASSWILFDVNMKPSITLLKLSIKFNDNYMICDFYLSSAIKGLSYFWIDLRMASTF